MEDPIISKELIDAFRPIMEMNNARFRQVKTMLAGFIATQERDLDYMDEYMDALLILWIPNPTPRCLCANTMIILRPSILKKQDGEQTVWKMTWAI